MPENCTHCGATVALIEDGWGVWHCLDRDGCLTREGWIAGLKLRNRELNDQLARAEARCATLERMAGELMGAIIGTARAVELNDIADKLEASWYQTPRPSSSREH